MTQDDDLGFWAAGHAGLIEEALGHARDRRERARERRVAADGWQARLLRAYLAAKSGTPLASTGYLLVDDDLFLDVEPGLLAVANAARVQDARAIEQLAHGEGPARSRRLDILRARGLALLEAFPDLALGWPEEGPPRSLELPPDPVTEIEMEALVDDVLRGAADLTKLSHGVLMVVLARIDRRKKAAEAAEQERRHLNGAPAMRGDIYDPVDFYSSQEWRAFLTAIAAIQAMVTSTWRPG